MKEMFSNVASPGNYFLKLEFLKKKLDDCLKYIKKEKPKFSNYKSVACMVVLEDDLQALIDEIDNCSKGFYTDPRTIDAFFEMSATVIEEVVSLQDSQERSMVIKPFVTTMKNYHHHSPRH